MKRYLKNRRIRPQSKNDDPIPQYGTSQLLLTVKLHYGGKFTDHPRLAYEGGNLCMVDYVGPAYISVDGLEELCGDVGLVGVRGLYLLVEGSGFVLTQNDDEFKKVFLSRMSSCHERVMNIYVNCVEKVDRVEEVSVSEEEDDSEGEEDVEGEEGGEDGGDSDYERQLEHFNDSDIGEDSDDELRNDARRRRQVVDEMLQSELREAYGGDHSNSETGARDNGVEDEVRDMESESTDSSTESDSGSDNVVNSGDELISEKGSDEEGNDVVYPVFKESDVWNPEFQLGMKFTSKKLLREAINSHAIKTMRNLKITSNDKRRMYAVCQGLKCKWRLNVVAVRGEEGTFRINYHYQKHRCSQTTRVKNVKSSWIARRYIQLFKTDPKRSVEGFMADVKSTMKCNLTRQQAYRAKIKALKILNGDSAEQYASLWDFIEEVNRTNPGSTVILSTKAEEGKTIFDVFYMCLAALKQGFLAGCRPIIGVDGAHLKGPHKGVLMTAVGVDANNNIFPIAWAVVAVENGDNWAWFLSLLKMDLNIQTNENWTFMSDKQKGLLQAFDQIFPGSDHRFCVRHLHGNFKRAGFVGIALKDKLWKAARATTYNQWAFSMHELRALSEDAYNWLNEKPPEHWSKSHFNPHPKCDILLNNGCEAFNACILAARDLPILSMLQWLMQYVMSRLQKNRDRAANGWKRDWCPKIRKLVEKSIATHGGECNPCKSDDDNYLINCWSGDQWAVNIANHTCGCRRWDISGIPCMHAASAISAQGLEVWDFINPYYSVEKYMDAYKYAIMPINGRKEWKKTNFVPPLPPNDGRGVGRPESARRVEPDERQEKKKRKCRGKPVAASATNSKRLKRAQRTVKCSYCGEARHNAKGCATKKQDVIEREARDVDEHPNYEEIDAQQQPFQASYDWERSPNTRTRLSRRRMMGVGQSQDTRSVNSNMSQGSNASGSGLNTRAGSTKKRMTQVEQSQSNDSRIGGSGGSKGITSPANLNISQASTISISQQINFVSSEQSSQISQHINNSGNVTVRSADLSKEKGKKPGIIIDAVQTPGPSIAQQIERATGSRVPKVVQKINNSGNTMLLRVGQSKKKPQQKKGSREPWKL